MQSGGIHHGQEFSLHKAEYIGADHLSIRVFRLQFCDGPYIPIIVHNGPCVRGWPEYACDHESSGCG